MPLSEQRALSLTARVRAYARFATVWHYYIGALIVWSLMPKALRFDLLALSTQGVFLLCQVSVLTALVALDDVTGYRDGSDAINYGPASGRNKTRKPLLSGSVSPEAAVRFGLIMAGAATVLFGFAAVVAPRPDLWVVLGGIAYVALSVQYSWGLKLSYHGAQELMITGLGVAGVVLPYALIVGPVSPTAMTQALLFGLGPLLFDVYSNLNDLAGDSQAGRMTLAVKLPRRCYEGLIAGLSIAELGIICGASVIGLMPWWFPAAMLPTVGLRARQLRAGVLGGDVVAARRLGIQAHRVTVVSLALINLVSLHSN